MSDPTMRSADALGRPILCATGESFVNSADGAGCELCACGHCIHEHEKWRWGRLCRVCTPAAYNADEDFPEGEMDRHFPAEPFICVSAAWIWRSERQR